MTTDRRPIGPIALVALALHSIVLASCNNVAATNNQTKATTEPRRPLKGYGSIEFGSSFTHAIATLGGNLFNAASVSDCFRDLPLKGCYLSRNSDGVPFEMKDGIPYTLSLSFNRYDKLTDIGLGYDREGDIAREDCLHIHERTFDWVTREYGALRFHQQRSEPTVQHQRRRTAGGNVYEVGFTSDRFFVTAPMRTVSSSMEPGVERRPIPQWDDQRYVSLLSTFIIVDGNPICSVNVDFNEPASVERRSMEQ